MPPPMDFDAVPLVSGVVATFRLVFEVRVRGLSCLLEQRRKQWQTARRQRRRRLGRKSSGSGQESSKNSEIESGWQEGGKNSETKGRR